MQSPRAAHMARPSRTSLQPHQLQPLNLPAPVRVETGAEGLPCAVFSKCRLPVAVVRDEWRIDDEWWPRPIARRYFQVALEGGRCVTVYQDLITRRWYRQNY
jgi:hypothetical protein